MKLLRLSAFAAAFVGLLAVPASAQSVQHISAVVNDEVVSAFDVEQRLRLVLFAARVADTPENRRRLRPQVLRVLVDEKLQVQAAERANVRLTSAEIDKEIDRLAAQSNIPPEALPEFLAQNNVQVGTLLARVRAALVWQKLITMRFAGRVRVTKAEVDEVLARLKANKGKPQYLAAEIFLAVNSPDEEDKVRQDAERLVKEIRAGAEFAGIAQQFSQASTAAVGGLIGWVQPGQAAPEIEAALSTMEIGSVSDPIEAEGGFYIMYLRDRSLILTDDPLDATVELKQILLKFDPNDPASLAAAKERAVALAQTATDCASFSAAAEKNGAPGSGDLGHLRVKELPPDLRDVVVSLEVGVPSPPVQRETRIHVLMVCERNQPTSVMPDEASVTAALGAQRLELMARRYLRDLQRDAVIEYR